MSSVVSTVKAEKIESITSVPIMVLSTGNPTTEEEPLSLGFKKEVPFIVLENREISAT